jgi:TonB-dependent SusC/RagA subfamily outer membrane receptor
MRAKSILVVLLVLVACTQMQGQKKNRNVVISGTVTYDNKSKVAGAMILADRMNTDVVTDSLGRFEIKVKRSVKTVGAFTYEFGSAEVALKDNKTVTIALDGTFAIKDFIPGRTDDEETVNIGYSKVNKKNTSTSVGSIDATEDRYSAYTNIYDLLSNQVPGVQVSGRTIRVRGVTSINASNDPLLVVDGMVVSSIDGINPREVKSISVLKGSEAAIYGSRGATGVILIDLKGSERK